MLTGAVRCEQTAKDVEDMHSLQILINMVVSIVTNNLKMCF